MGTGKNSRRQPARLIVVDHSGAPRTGPAPPLPWPPRSIPLWPTWFRPPSPVPPEWCPPDRSKRRRPTHQAWRRCAGPAASGLCPVLSGGEYPPQPNRRPGVPWRRSRRCTAPRRIPQPQPPAGPPSPAAVPGRSKPTASRCSLWPSHAQSPHAPATAAGCGRCRRPRPR